MSAVKKIMKVLGFVKKTEYFHLTIIKGTGENEGAKVVELPVRTNQSEQIILPKHFETLVIDITH